jgi:YVTN family beta-propeller protein
VATLSFGGGLHRLATALALSAFAWTSLVHAKPYSFIPLHDQASVAVYDHGTSAWLPSITVGNSPIGVAPDAAQRFLYVSNYQSGSVSVIRIANRLVARTITVGGQPMGIALSPTQPRAYVANFASNTISVIDTESYAVLSTITVGLNPSGLAMSSNGARLFVANTGDSTVSVIDTASNTVTSTINTVGSRPYGLAYVDNGGSARLLVSNNNAGSVTILNGATFAAITTLTVGAHPTLFAPVSANKVYVLNQFDSTLSVIDPFSTAVIGSPITLPTASSAIAHAPGSGFASITTFPGTLSIINSTTNTLGAGVAIPGSPKAPLGFGAFVTNPAFECALDLNNDNAYNAADATAIMRYLAGYRGAGIANGIAGISASNIDSYLDLLNLDADGVDSARAATDGLLFTRAARSQIGADLIANARNTSIAGVRNATQILQWMLDTHGVNCLP